ncbi:MAG: NADP-dependent oxidoreductase [Oleispira sp.]|nr:NADP-dependent oxidoreductase [Oleispira sp.]MBL4880930.1 NADP-dependent oxidoreductase [Oleispira sp.]
MKAALIQTYGDIKNLVHQETVLPEISATQVLIKVHAAGVNPVDSYIRSGMFADTGTHTLPLTLGWDAAGTIDRIGSEVGADAVKGISDLKIGDEVFVFSAFAQNGSYAEYLAVEADLVVIKPKTLSFTESAAVPLAAVTAWQALFSEGKLQAGQRVLIHNTSGGVGGFAVQLAKAAGAYVIGTASAKNEQYVKGLGVDEFINYQTEKFEDQVDSVDLVFAAVGGDNIVERSLKVIKPGGHLISALDELDHGLAEEQQVKFERIWVQPNGQDLNEIRKLIDEGKVTVNLDSVFPLAEAQQAHARSESKRAVGKIVLEVIV